jgi:hypothetical protein
MEKPKRQQPENNQPDDEQIDEGRRSFMKGLAAFAAGTVIGGLSIGVREAAKDEEECSSEPEEKKGKEQSVKEKIERIFEGEYEEVVPNEFFDSNPEYLGAITSQGGEWSAEQRRERTQTLPGGERVFRDVGLTFYYVNKGDTISSIRKRLSEYEEFSYLKSGSSYKLYSFNIPARKLRAGLWIPIPTEARDRHLSEAQFINYAGRAIDEIKEHPHYGAEVERILQKVSERELIATMIAVAQQEGGDKPLGQFVLHRWEDHQRAFSFSYYHVLMKGPGLEARRKLNLTEGQLYHPQNAAKLFLAFLIEKCAERRRHADRYFPISEHQKDFASFYNGRRWKKTNPNYLVNYNRYYAIADEHLSKDGRRWKKPVPQQQ